MEPPGHSNGYVGSSDAEDQHNTAEGLVRRDPGSNGGTPAGGNTGTAPRERPGERTTGERVSRYSEREHGDYRENWRRASTFAFSRSEGAHPSPFPPEPKPRSAPAPSGGTGKTTNSPHKFALRRSPDRPVAPLAADVLQRPDPIPFRSRSGSFLFSLTPTHSLSHSLSLSPTPTRSLSFSHSISHSLSRSFSISPFVEHALAGYHRCVPGGSCAWSELCHRPGVQS